MFYDQRWQITPFKPVIFSTFLAISLHFSLPLFSASMPLPFPCAVSPSSAARSFLAFDVQLFVVASPPSSEATNLNSWQVWCLKRYLVAQTGLQSSNLAIIMFNVASIRFNFTLFYMLFRRDCHSRWLAKLSSIESESNWRWKQSSQIA